MLKAFKRLFTDSGITSLLEATDYESKNIIPPYYRAIVDMLCGDGKNTAATKTFTEFVDLVNFILSQNRARMWNEQKLSRLANNIVSLKQIVYSLFCKYLHSSKRTSKWHVLEHVVEDIRRMGSVTFMSSSIFEKSYSVVNENYKATSRREQNAMRELLE